jgi:hypothetical protein
MKDLKTTITGFFVALAVFKEPLAQAYEAGVFDGKTGWALVGAIAIVLLGYFTKDKTKNDTQASAKEVNSLIGTRPKDRE